MYIYIFITFIIILLFILNKNTIEKYTDLWDATKGQRDVKTFTDGLFKGVKDVIEGAVLGFDTKIPGQKPCSDWDSRYRDDKTSCWLDTYGRGAGRIMDYAPCPPRSSENWSKDCYADQTDREDGRNDAEPWGKSWDKSDGCSWNRHIEAGMCFRACPNGYFGRAHEKCWANGANSFGVMKYGVDRERTCNSDEEKWGLLCYPKCKSGYKAVGCCLCEPNEGPGIKVTAFDRYLCPPPGNPDYVNLKGALCYRDLPNIQGKKQIQNSNGQSIKCNTDVPGGVEGGVYRVQDGNLRWYPSERIANSWDSNWRNAKMISDCSAVSRIGDMRYKSEDQLEDAIRNNRSVKCGREPNGGAGGGAVYRVENGKLRWYPNPNIAGSWDSNWSNPVTVDDCTITSRDADMKLKDPNLKNNNILWQRDNYNNGDLYWMKYTSYPWDKYYKFSCKDDSNNESNINGPFGPVNWPGQPYLAYPNIRLADDNVRVCGSGKVTVYRSDSRDGKYVDISDDPKLFNKANNAKYNRLDSVFTDDIDVPYIPPPNLKNDNILWQRNDYNGGDLYWMKYTDKHWNKYYKFSCRTDSNNESDVKGPFGPVSWIGPHTPLAYPNIRLADDNVSVCGNNKVTVYRSDSKDGPYTEISDNPNLFNKANNTKYNRRDSVFTDDVDTPTNTYKYIMSTDAGGNDITHFDNVSWNTCKTECDNRSNCRGFNFSAASYPNKPGTCWIKHNVSNKSGNSNWNLFEKV